MSPLFPFFAVYILSRNMLSYFSAGAHPCPSGALDFSFAHNALRCFDDQELSFHP